MGAEKIAERVTTNNIYVWSDRRDSIKFPAKDSKIVVYKTAKGR